jgi:hypothetical protein
MHLERLPRGLRRAIFTLAVAVLLYLSLAPTRELPDVRLWDKAEHAIAWFVLTALGLALGLWRPRTLVAFAFGLGAGVELLQAALGLGRQGDWRDLAFDCLGIAAALLAWAGVRRVAVRP